MQLRADFRRHQQWLQPIKPKIGTLMALGDENYRLITQLVPNLVHLEGTHDSTKNNQLGLHLNIIEQTKYTSLFLLTHQISSKSAIPNATFRAYHDAYQLELIALESRLHHISNQYEKPALYDKIQANTFINKWLHYCRDHHYYFKPIK